MTCMLSVIFIATASAQTEAKPGGLQIIQSQAESRVNDIAFNQQTMGQSQANAQESLLVGPGDLLHIQAFDIPELEQRVRVSDAGQINCLFLGDIKVVGMAPNQISRLIESKLITGNFVLHPQITVTDDQTATLGVSILGYVRTPGTYALSTPRDIIQILSLAGGVLDVASWDIVVQRHSSGARLKYRYSNNPDLALADLVTVYPGDTVFVPKAGIVYVLGDVGHAGAYVMQNDEAKLTVLQAVAYAGGTNHTAVPSHARLIRKTGSATFDDIHIPLSDMQKGRKGDLALLPGDIIYVPFSYLRNFALQASTIAAAAVSSATYLH